MNRPEGKMWDYLGPKLKAFGHFDRIETGGTALGVPDVDYCIEGYQNHLELKYTEKDKGCILRPSQCVWFKKRTKAGGQPWLLLQAKIRETRGWFLIPGTNVPPLIKTKDIKDWMAASVIAWEGKIDINQLIEFLGTYLVVVPEVSTEESGSSKLVLPTKDLII